MAAAQVQVQEPPNELCGIWAYIKWEAAGCPNRSGEESDREYQRAIQVRAADCHITGVELRTVLRPGADLTTLRGIARRNSVRSEVHVSMMKK